MFTPEFFIQIFGLAAAAVGIYSGIRVSIVSAIMKAEQAVTDAKAAADSAKECHSRLDGHIDFHLMGK